jgi:hypothetical protein
MTNLGTIEHVKAMYALFCKLPPFDKIQMPLPSQIEWIIVNDPEILGMYQPSPHVITISLARQTHFDNICKTILHEMVHMLLYLQGKANYEKHDKTFKKWTHKIATIYGYDPKEL